MSAPAKVAKFAPASAVREFARQNDIEVGARGLFSTELVKAFNAKSPVKYRKGAYVPTVTVKAKPAKGRTVERRVNVAQARAAALAAGVPVGARGRLPQSVLADYALGTLGK